MEVAPVGHSVEEGGRKSLEKREKWENVRSTNMREGRNLQDYRADVNWKR